MNTIKIKHGANAPSNGTLQPYELGYITSTGTLVIGDANKNTKALNYLQLDSNGYIPILYTNGNLSLSSTADNPKLWIEASGKGSKGSYGIQGSNGQAYILEYAPNSTYYERYNLPSPSTSLTADKTYTILTTKGGTFAGNFTFSNTIKVNGTLTANGGIIVDTDSYGYYDPNGVPGDSSKPAKDGVAGQLYFVLVEE